MRFVYFTVSNTGHVVGVNGSILKTINGGGSSFGYRSKTLVYPNKLNWGKDSLHFKVYSAKGTHGNYDKCGSYKIPDLLQNIPIVNLLIHTDYCDYIGYEWDTYNNLQPLGNTDLLFTYMLQLPWYLKQPWQNYARAWGKVGIDSDHTGLLGPFYQDFQ